MLAFLPTAAYFETRLDTHIVSIQELPFTHGQSPWNSALRVIRRGVIAFKAGLARWPICQMHQVERQKGYLIKKGAKPFY